MRQTTTDSTFARGARRGAGSSAGWGGFLLARCEPRILHVTLTGHLSLHTLRELDGRLAVSAVTAATSFLVLDASHLQHIPLDVAERLVERERRWRGRGVVALWIGLSRYLANLLVLACRSEDQLPVLSDLATAREWTRGLQGVSAPVARARLEMCTTLVH